MTDHEDFLTALLDHIAENASEVNNSRFVYLQEMGIFDPEVEALSGEAQSELDDQKTNELLNVFLAMQQSPSIDPDVTVIPFNLDAINNQSRQENYFFTNETMRKIAAKLTARQLAEMCCFINFIQQQLSDNRMLGAVVHIPTLRQFLRGQLIPLMKTSRKRNILIAPMFDAYDVNGTEILEQAKNGEDVDLSTVRMSDELMEIFKTPLYTLMLPTLADTLLPDPDGLTLRPLANGMIRLNCIILMHKNFIVSFSQLHKTIAFADPAAIYAKMVSSGVSTTLN